ncbi:MAG: hypothetical protein FJ115_01445 [Deltaproteobacteria bacterium]|nr:hypothetical protein [Deltaproteobacteria bacterium]MBM4322198.1 hypothetical protein [Deltaproteobacteria bacterium]MBM4346861.1 hypothetical protein [Deltaproteobacteria bacterium]
MKTLKIPGFALFAILFLIQPAIASEKVLTIKIGTLAPEGSSWIKTLNAINAETIKKTENRVQFRIYHSGVLGDEMDMLRKMRIGQIHGAAFTAGGLSPLFKEIEVFQVPFLFQTYEEADYILTKMDGFFRKGFEDNGHTILGWSEAGFVYLMSNSPVSSVADLKKTKVWIWEESPMSKAIFDEAGISTIPLSVPDVLLGLQTGLVDVVYAPPTGAISLQWFTKIKYISDVPLSYLIGAVVIHRETFRRIPLPYQTVLLESFNRHLLQLKGVTRSENRDAIKVMMKHGIKVITPSQGQIEEFKKLSERAMEKVGTQSFSKKVLNEVKIHLDNYRMGRK